MVNSGAVAAGAFLALALTGGCAPASEKPCETILDGPSFKPMPSGFAVPAECEAHRECRKFNQLRERYEQCAGDWTITDTPTATKEN